MLKAMKNKFLFELGTEEIPAGMIEAALTQMSQSCKALLGEHHLTYQRVRTFSSPRRLALLVEGVPDGQSDREEVVMGPPRSVAFDDSDKPTKAAEGFARKLTVSVADLEILDTAKGAYLAYRHNVLGKATVEIIPDILPEILNSISWPKNMYWRKSRFRFIRPLRWFIVLWNEESLAFEFEGVKSGRTTRGHRFLAGEPVTLSNVDEYVEKMRQNFVLVDTDERRQKIENEIAQQTPPNLQVLFDPALLDMVVLLNEYPSVICGHFSENFLELPQEVLVTVMRHHQKYFSLIDEVGRIQAHFLTVLNTDADPDGQIQKGHETVLEARLEDAVFFWESDRKRSLAEREEDLDQVLFQEKLGTYRAKTARVCQLCAALKEDLRLQEAARLCKVDLTTEMVREFTELQGVMGGVYAREEGCTEEVWRAIYEHYKPVSLEDTSPQTPLGAVLSLADKLDSVVGCFSVGIIPKGSRDPFALRRQAQGLVKVLFDHDMNYMLADLVELAQKPFSVKNAPEVRDRILHFLIGRIRRIFQDKGLPYDVLNAVLAVGTGTVGDAYQRAKSLAKIKSEEDFEALAIAYKRIKNILTEQPVELSSISDKYLEEPEERNLYASFAEIRPKVVENIENHNYTAALRQMASLRETVDGFFDKVLVLTDEDHLRQNRLRLLFEISQLFLRVADISKIVQKGV